MAAAFDDLPLRRPGPPLNAWGLYGDDDELGRLNLITPETVKKGLAAAKSGKVVNLNLPLDYPRIHPSREPLEHTINHRVHCNDDILHFNTQGSTQWDGFRHYAYHDYPSEGEYTFYNGLTREEAKDKSVHKLGIQNYVKKPITSRAHLLDIPSYLTRHSLHPLSYFDTSTPITVDILRACAKDANVTIEPGDILVVRTGWTEAFEGLSEEDRKAIPYRDTRGFGGVDQSEEALRWHWDMGIAAVVTDGVAYECMPAPHSPSMHEVFLSGWGLPIGELFDLRELAKACEERGNWSFLFTSMPLYVNGGIASPPNAQAIL